MAAAILIRSIESLGTGTGAQPEPECPAVQGRTSVAVVCFLPRSPWICWISPTSPVCTM